MPATWGIDLGNALLKVGVMDGKRIEALSVVSNPLGKLAIDTELEMNSFAAVIKKILIDLKIEKKQVKLVIPDGLAYFRVISLPILSDTELSSAIRYEAEQYVPVKLDEVELSWDVIDRPKEKKEGGKMQVLLVAAVRENVAKMVELMSRAELEVEAIEPEVVAASRALVFGKGFADGTMLCSMGATGMTISVFNAEKLVFVYRYGSGGVALTRAVSATLQLTMSQAEEYKRAYGMQANVLEGKLGLAMMPVVDGMISEMKKAISFFSQNNPGVRLGRVILSGGTALMPGLIQLMTSKLGIEVAFGDPFTGLSLKAETMRSSASICSAVVGTLKE